MKNAPISKLFLFALITALPFFLIAALFPFEKTTSDATQVEAAADYTLPTVIIDPGHGGEDGGTSGGSVVEKDLNLDIALSLRDLLLLSGVNVVITRTEDILLYDRGVDYHGRKKVLDQAARLKIAQSAGNAVFVSIHMNAFPEEKYSGLQVYFSPNNEESATLARLIQDNTHTFLQPDNNRKIKNAKTTIYLLDRLDIPAVLVECGFLSNKREAVLLSDQSYRKELVMILFYALTEFIYPPAT